MRTQAQSLLRSTCIPRKIYGLIVLSPKEKYGYNYISGEHHSLHLLLVHHRPSNLSIYPLLRWMKNSMLEIFRYLAYHQPTRYCGEVFRPARHVSPLIDNPPSAQLSSSSLRRDICGTMDYTRNLMYKCT